MTTFVDRVVLHVAAGNGGHGWPPSSARSSSRSAAPTAATAAGAARSSSRSTRSRPRCSTTTTPRTARPPTASPVAATSATARTAPTWCCRCPTAPSSRTAPAPCSPTWSGTTPPSSSPAAAAAAWATRRSPRPRRKAPGFALLGEPGESIDIVLELKTLADVALVGFPSAGKSSLVSVMSAAQPKIADYPFTTLVPNLGVVTAGSQRFTIADVPGLIPGASEGKGLGLEFLRHVERCSVLVHVLDCATLEPGRDPMTDLDVIEAELAAYVPTTRWVAGRCRTAPASSCSTRSTCPTAATSPRWCGPCSRSAASRCTSSRRSRTPGSRSSPSRWPRHVLAARAGSSRGSSSARGSSSGRSPSTTPASSCAARTPPTARSSGCSASSPGAGSTRPTSPTTRPSATSPTGSAGSASRRRCSRPAPCRARRCSSAPRTTPSSSTGSPP